MCSFIMPFTPGSAYAIFHICGIIKTASWHAILVRRREWSKKRVKTWKSSKEFKANAKLRRATVISCSLTMVIRDRGWLLYLNLTVDLVKLFIRKRGFCRPFSVQFCLFLTCQSKVAKSWNDAVILWLHWGKFWEVIGQFGYHELLLIFRFQK
jgi:hypothetical protein